MIGRAAAAVAVLLLGPAGAAAHGGEQHVALADHWWDAWTFSPLQLAPILLAMALYAWRAGRLGRARLPLWRQSCFQLGMLVFALALVSPIDAIAEEGLFWVHMLQHALIAGLAPLLVALGITGPLLQPLLRFSWLHRLAALAHPMIALPLWTAVFLVWHVPPIYDAGIENDFLHALEHGTFFVTALLIWMPVTEPLPAPEWFGTWAKIGYLTAYWFIGLLFVNVLWFSGTVFFERYEATAPEWGMTALRDQATAGTVFMVEHALLVASALLFLFLRAAREGALRQRLIEAGGDPGAVARAVRYGRAEHMARSMGVSVRTRAGVD